MRVLSLRTGARLAVTALASVLVLPVGSAAGAAKAASVEPEFCATLLGTERDGAGNSVTLARSCSDRSPQAAAAALPAASKTKLTTWYEHAGWKGHSEDMYGDQGTCDHEGYTFSPNWYWFTHMSSIRGYGNCNVVWLSNRHNSMDSRLPLSFGATEFNDNVWKLNVSYLPRG